MRSCRLAYHSMSPSSVVSGLRCAHRLRRTRTTSASERSLIAIYCSRTSNITLNLAVTDDDDRLSCPMITTDSPSSIANCHAEQEQPRTAHVVKAAAGSGTARRDKDLTAHWFLSIDSDEDLMLRSVQVLLRDSLCQRDFRNLFSTACLLKTRRAFHRPVRGLLLSVLVFLWFPP